MRGCVGSELVKISESGGEPLPICGGLDHLPVSRRSGIPLPAGRRGGVLTPRDGGSKPPVKGDEGMFVSRYRGRELLPNSGGSASLLEGGG